MVERCRKTFLGELNVLTKESGLAGVSKFYKRKRVWSGILGTECWKNELTNLGLFWGK